MVGELAFGWAVGAARLVRDVTCRLSNTVQRSTAAAMPCWRRLVGRTIETTSILSAEGFDQDRFTGSVPIKGIDRRVGLLGDLRGTMLIIDRRTTRRKPLGFSPRRRGGCAWGSSARSLSWQVLLPLSD